MLKNMNNLYQTTSKYVGPCEEGVCRISNTHILAKTNTQFHNILLMHFNIFIKETLVCCGSTGGCGGIAVEMGVL